MLNANQSAVDPTNARRRFNGQYPNVGTNIQLNSTTNSSYNALQTTLGVKSWHGLTSQLAYIVGACFG